MEFTSERNNYTIYVNENEQGSQWTDIVDFRYYDRSVDCNNLEELIELRNALNRAIEYYTNN
jgi:hypothetical protein